MKRKYCTICGRRRKLKKELDGIGKELGGYERELRRLPLERKDGTVEKGYVDKLRECPNCRKVAGSAVTEFEWVRGVPKPMEHKHVCQDCGWELTGLSGDYADDGLE